MASSVRISCINKTDHTDAHGRMASVGGVNRDGKRWKLTEANAIAGIERGEWAFYVDGPDGRSVAVIVAARLGRKYLKTVADGEQPNNLLSLPECP